MPRYGTCCRLSVYRNSAGSIEAETLFACAYVNEVFARNISKPGAPIDEASIAAIVLILKDLFDAPADCQNPGGEVTGDG